MMNRKKIGVVLGFEFLLITVSGFFSIQNAHALPAFARREDASCTLCHTNGSAPHLTKAGYMFRRAGFRMPNEIGDKEADKKALSIDKHMTAGVNFDYDLIRSGAPAATSLKTTSDNFDMREAELWPLVGGFFGNYSVWSEIDAVPGTTGPDGGVSLNQADLRYVYGQKDLFFNFRGGMIAPEGFGASDQWLDDGGIPLMDTLTPQATQDTLALPLGAMQTPQLGAEFGGNYLDTHLTLGLYNGFVGATTAGTDGTLTPALMKAQHGRDYKVQLDQFIGKYGAVTAVYYSGSIMLPDPAKTYLWNNHYKQYRLYLTGYAIPEKLDIVAGGAINKSEYVVDVPASLANFTSRGAFLGAFVYPWDFLTLSARYDFFQYNTTSFAPALARGYSLQASVPQGNNLFVFHFNHTKDQLAGTTDDFRAEWRLLL